MALLTALVGPLFVDWNAFRSDFEKQAEALIGHKVRVDGSADAQFLPLPSLTFNDVRIGEAGTPPLMTVKKFSVRLELFPLLTGEIRVINMTLERPTANVHIDDKGGFEWLSTTMTQRIDPKKVILEKVEIVGGRLNLLDDRRGTTYTASDFNAVVDARSLAGPYKLEGAAVFNGEPAMIRASAGEIGAADGTRVGLEITPANHPFSIVVDGLTTVKDDVPSLAGKLTVQRLIAKDDTETRPLRLTSDLELDPFRLLLKDGELRFGTEDKSLVFTGAANVTFGVDPTFDAVVSARQIDVDRALGGGAQSPVGFDEALQGLGAALASLPVPPISGQLGFDIPGLVVGGDLIQNLRFDASVRSGQWHIEQLEARLPGQSELAATGDIKLVPGLAFKGHAALASRQPSALIAWWRPGNETGRLAAFTLGADVTASADHVVLDNLSATIADADVAGSIDFTPAIRGRKPLLVLSLSAETLDLDAARALAGLIAGKDPAKTVESADLALNLSAGTLVSGNLSAGGVDINARVEGGAVTLDRFKIDDVGGVSVNASGKIVDVIGAPDGRIEASLTADKAADAVALVNALMPGTSAAELFRTSAPVLMPLRLRAKLDARARGKGSILSAEVDGDAGASKIDTRVTFEGHVDEWRDSSIGFDLNLQGPNGARLMRQLGFDVDDGGKPGAGKVVASANGTPATGMDVTANASLGNTSVAVKGNATFAEGQRPTTALDVAIRSDDIGPVLALGGPTLASLVETLPIDVSVHVDSQQDKVTLADIKGTAIGTPVTGDLALDLAPQRPSLTGQLSLGEASLAGFAELALGSGTLEPPVTSDTVWPDVPFGPSLVEGLDGDIAVTTSRLDLADGFTLANAAFHLRSSATGFAIDDMTGGIAGGRTTASLVIKRQDSGSAHVALRASLTGGALEDVIWRSDDRPVATGALDLNVDLSGSGRTLAGIIAGLGGGGNVTVTDGRLRSFNPAAFDAVTRAVDAGLGLDDAEIEKAFAAQVNSGDLAFSRLDGAFSAAAGTLRAPRIILEGVRAKTDATATVDLVNDSLLSDWTMSVDPGDDAVTGATPQAAILFRGPIEAPQRRIDVTAFTAYLTLRSFEREVQRVEAMQSDIQEREVFTRQLKRMKQDQEQAARDAEAARIAAEEAAKAAAEKAAADQAAQEKAAQDAAEAASRDAEARAAAEKAAAERAAVERAAAEKAAAEQAAKAAAEKAAAEEAARAAAEKAAAERAAAEKAAAEAAAKAAEEQAAAEKAAAEKAAAEKAAAERAAAEKAAAEQARQPAADGQGADAIPPDSDAFTDLIKRQLDQLDMQPLPPPVNVAPPPGQ
nr:AsmA-like C-terminal region-containing protein [Hartmannibacter diazotrophicus]